jgi:LysB family phage lysis regulatory protein
MTRILITVGIILALLGANAWQYHQVQQQAERAATAEQNAADRQAKILRLQADAREREQAQQAMEQTQRDLRAQLGKRELTIRELQRENQEYRDWADNHLPAVTRRLRKRPAITGAGEYQQWLLSQSEPLQPASNSAGTERRSD